MPFTRMSPAVGSYRRVRLFSKSSFAAAGRTDDAQELAFLYFKVQIIQHQQVTEPFLVRFCTFTLGSLFAIVRHLLYSV